MKHCIFTFVLIFLTMGNINAQICGNTGGGGAGNGVNVACVGVLQGDIQESCSFYGNQETYIPDGSDPLNTPPDVITLKLAFHIIQDAAGNNDHILQDGLGNNDIDETIERFRRWVTQINSTFKFGSHGLLDDNDPNDWGPTDPVTGVPQDLNDDLNDSDFDTRIQFDLGDRIYFHDGDALGINGVNNWNALETAVTGILEPDVINIFFTLNSPLGADGRVENIGSYNPDERIFMEITENPVVTQYITLVHELGHLFDLGHLYVVGNGTGTPGECINGVDFLDDVIQQNCPCPVFSTIQLGGAAPLPSDANDDCFSNNIMAGGVWVNYISPKQMGRMHRMLHLGNMRRAVEDCPYSDVPLEITQDEEWDFDIRMYRDVIVKTGATLTITGRLNMPSKGRIIVERGARLIVDDGVITNACTDERWKGIEVWGNSAIAHTNEMREDTYIQAPDDPGIVIVRNGSCIANANDAAITTKRKGTYDEATNCYHFDVSNEDKADYYGGLVVGEDAIFHNNERAAEFLRYDFPNRSQFTGCTFLADDTYENLPTNLFRGISMHRVDGVEFDNCDFRVEVLPDVNHKGISTLDASFVVRNGCKFDNISRAIDVGASMTLNTPIQIGLENDNPNIFTNNSKDIVIEGASVDIRRNFFLNSWISTTIGGDGIVSIEENTFRDFQKGIFTDCTNTGGNNNLTIDCNTFESDSDMAQGILFQRDNSGATFENNDFDVSINIRINGSITNPGTIQNFQGTNFAPVANLFSNQGDGIDIETGESNFFNYLHFDPDINPRLEPRCDIDELNCFTNYSFRADESGFGTSAEDYFGCLDIQQEPPPFPCMTKNCLNGLQVEIVDVKYPLEQGGGPGMWEAITYYPNANSTHTMLIDNSPYIADFHLAAIAKNDEMQLWKREDVLIRNAPLSDSLMLVAQDEVSDYAYQVLYTIKYYDDFSDRSILEMYVSDKEKEKDFILNTLLKEALEQNDATEVTELLAGEQNRRATRQLSSLHMRAGEFNTAIDILDIENTTNLNEQYFHTLQSINTSIGNTGLENFNLSLEEENALQEIANSETVSAAHARALLSWLTGTILEREILPMPVGKRSKPTYKVVPLLNEWQEQKMFVSPNPVQQQAQVFFNTILAGEAEVVFYNLEGKIMNTLPIYQEQKTLSFTTTDWQNGVYLACLMLDGKCYTQSKFLVWK